MSTNTRLPRVVFVDHVARLSGGEIALLHLTSALRGFVEPHVILGAHGPLVERLQAHDVPVEVLPLGPRVPDLPRARVSPMRITPRLAASTIADVWRLRRRLRQLAPDIVHTNSLKAAIYGGLAGRLAGIPVVWHIRDRITEDYLPRPAVILVRVLARILPQVVIANSQTTLMTIHRRRKVFVVYNHVVPESVQALSERIRSVSDVFTVGILGRIAPWKGQHVFLEAFAEAFRGQPARARVIGSPLFGEDDYAEALARQAEALGITGQVDFRGFREDVWTQLSELDVLVHCSTIPEPFGQVVLEGMAAGLPVVARNEGGPAELIRHDINGILVPSGDATALAAALRALADDPSLCATLGQAAQERSGDFSPQATVSHLMSIYGRMLGTNAVAPPPSSTRR